MKRDDPDRVASARALVAALPRMIEEADARIMPVAAFGLRVALDDAQRIVEDADQQIIAEYQPTRFDG